METRNYLLHCPKDSWLSTVPNCLQVLDKRLSPLIYVLLCRILLWLLGGQIEYLAYQCTHLSFLLLLMLTTDCFCACYVFKGVPILNWGSGIADGKIDLLLGSIRIVLQWDGRYNFFYEVPEWIFDVFYGMVAVDLFLPCFFMLHDRNYIKISTEL